MMGLYVIGLVIGIGLSTILLFVVGAIALNYVDKKILNKKK